MRRSGQPLSGVGPDAPSRRFSSASERKPGPGQDSAAYIENLNDSVEQMRRETGATRNASASSTDLDQRFKQHMIPFEDDRNDVYLDHLGKPTVGIGHLVRPGDNLKVGDRISDARKETFWRKESAIALEATQKQMKEAGITDPNFILALAAVNFQLGPHWRAKFKKTWPLIMNGEYEAAAREAQDSDWYGQTPKRVEAFQKALLALPSKPAPMKQSRASATSG